MTLDDGWTRSAWDCDAGVLQRGRLHHVVICVDGGPKIITFVVDGALCDGGAGRPFGSGRFHRHLRGLNGSNELRIAPRLRGRIASLRIYGRYLRTSEAISHFHAGW